MYSVLKLPIGGANELQPKLKDLHFLIIEYILTFFRLFVSISDITVSFLATPQIDVNYG